jgi:ferric-dicitrate binding protein FerR (iron transport regulator)
MKKNMTEKDRSQRDDETMARLLKLAGRSEPISSEIEDRVYRAVRQEWVASTSKPDSTRVYTNVRREWNKTPARRSRVRRWAMPLAIAASTILAITVVLQPAPPVENPVPIGTVAKNVAPQAGRNDVGSEIFVGDRLTTGTDGGMSLRLSNAESLRLDENTTLVVMANNRFKLVEGRVYADTGNFMYRDKGLVIDTPMGVVTDVGTQFSVDLDAGLLDVAVREGRVDVLNDGRELVAVAGERMRIESGREATFEDIAAHDDYWEWVSMLAPAYDIENRSLLDFLRWAARETGYELVFETNGLRMSAMRTDLHGSVEGFEPTEAIGAVLSTTTFNYRFDGEKLVIYRD